MDTDIAHRWLAVGNARLCVRDTEPVRGHSDCVLFLHAGVADSRMWRAQQHHLRARVRTLAFDQRGFGGTEAKASEFDPLDDLVAVLDDAGQERAVVVGCSMGGALALRAAIELPQRVHGLVLIASAPAVDVPRPEHSLPTKSLLDALADAEKRGDLDAVNALEARIWLDGPEQPEGRVGGAARKLFLDMNGIALRAPPIGTPARGGALRDRLETLRVPTLLMPCALDFPAIEAGMRKLASTLANAALARLDDCAHLPSLERPNVVNEQLDAFLPSVWEQARS